MAWGGGPRPGHQTYDWIKEASTMQYCDLIGLLDVGVTDCIRFARGISRVLLRPRCVSCRAASRWVSMCVLPSAFVPAASEGHMSEASRGPKEAVASPAAHASSPAAPRTPHSAPAAGCCDFSPPTRPAAFGLCCLIRHRCHPKSLRMSSHPLYRWGAQSLAVE